MRNNSRSEAEPMAENYLSENQAAAYANVSVAKLRKDRLMKRGFNYCRMGRRVIYRRSDIDDEMSRNLAHSASA